MSSHFSSIKKAANNLFDHQRGVVSVRLIHPKRDWVIGILITGACVVGFIGWSVYMYSAHSAPEALAQDDVEIPRSSYRTEQVDRALEYFKEREAAFMVLRQEVEMSGLSGQATDTETTNEFMQTESAPSMDTSTSTSSIEQADESNTDADSDVLIEESEAQSNGVPEDEFNTPPPNLQLE